MPALPEASLLSIVGRGANSTSPNATNLGVQVVCAWPVSGQYGPGSRSLYYALVAVCVFARKAAWLRKACLAAALLFPAVAALHAIILAAVHVNGAADMDVYGSFQVCAIGILAAPVTVRLSGTYLKDPGRNIIYVWTFLLLAGLLSLMVEFIRIDAISCTYDNSGNPISTDPSKFPYGNASCNLPCYVGPGPNGNGFSSPIRQGSANNIYIIPEPDKLTFNTATLMAAGCCLPAILSLITMWNKILEINWKKKNTKEAEERDNEFITGTNGATPREMKSLNVYLRKVLGAVEIPVFGAAVLAILVLGEENFFSPQVDYQTEPIASVGQWAPIVGTGLALLGSLYILLMKGGFDDAKEEEKPSVDTHHCNCSGHGDGERRRRSSDSSISVAISTGPINDTPPPTGATEDEKELHNGYRAKVSDALTSLGEWFGTPGENRFDDSGFRRGRADDYPTVPGENLRNEKLLDVQSAYNRPRDADGNVTPRAGSPHSQVSRRRAMTLESQRTSFDTRGEPSSLSAEKRRTTLQVPATAHYSLSRSASAGSPIRHIPQDQSSPTIIISSNADEPSVEHEEYAEETRGKDGA